MKVTWQLRRDGDGWSGVVNIPINPAAMPGGGVISVASKAQPTKAAALGKAATAAKMVEDQMAKHPALAALLPPGTGLALHAMSGIAKSAVAGKLEKALSKHAGPAIKRLGKVLGL